MAKGIHDPRYRRVIDRLIEERNAKRLTQEAVAALLGKPQQYVSRYEIGERRLDLVEFIDAANALGIDGLDLARAVLSQG